MDQELYSAFGTIIVIAVSALIGAAMYHFIPAYRRWVGELED